MNIISDASDVKFLLLSREDDGNVGYWIADVQHNGWDIVEEFVWPANMTENVLIEWLERLISEGKITVADAIRCGIYNGNKKYN